MLGFLDAKSWGMAGGIVSVPRSAAITSLEGYISPAPASIPTSRGWAITTYWYKYADLVT